MTALRWQPTKNITVDYSLEYHRYRDSSMASQLTYVYPNSFPSFPVAPLGPGGSLVPNPFYGLLPGTSLAAAQGLLNTQVLTLSWAKASLRFILLAAASRSANKRPWRAWPARMRG